MEAETAQHDRWLSPDEQISQVQTSLAAPRAQSTCAVRDLELRDATDYLAKMRRLHATGYLAPLPYHPSMPF